MRNEPPPERKCCYWHGIGCWDEQHLYSNPYIKRLGVPCCDDCPGDGTGEHSELFVSHGNPAFESPMQVRRSVN